jgi:hypothetical protein
MRSMLVTVASRANRRPKAQDREDRPTAEQLYFSALRNRIATTIPATIAESEAINRSAARRPPSAQARGDSVLHSRLNASASPPNWSLPKKENDAMKNGLISITDSKNAPIQIAMNRPILGPIDGFSIIHLFNAASKRSGARKETCSPRSLHGCYDAEDP